MNRPASPGLLAGVTFQHPVAFWCGCAAVAAGVLGHLPSFFGAGSMGYHMADMTMSPLMVTAMLLILVGLCLAAYGIIPRAALRKEQRAPAMLHFHALNDARLTGAHWGLLFVLGVALIVDVMKPATLGFVVPGMKGEYGLTNGQVALYPLTALTGTTIGSLLWGVLADRIGRRASILLASVLFMATSICGFMPSFGWNLFMCLIMGISAGGMLPIVYALMAESIPAKKRGWLVVLHGGMGTVGGYLVAAGLAALLEPQYTWRILWFAGLPTGLMVLVLNRWIPESPRFLLEKGRAQEAEEVMARYGIVLTSPAPAAQEVAAPQPRHGVFARRYLMHTLTVISYGVGWGLVNWGFIMFIPTVLRDQGVAAGSASRLLFFSALIAVPATIVCAALYGLWSSRKSMILFAFITVASLIAFAVVDPGSASGNPGWLMPLTVLLLIGSGGVISMLSPYTAEVYPTALRGTGSGIAAASSKIGGIAAPPIVAMILAITPGFTVLALAIAAPMLVSLIILTIGAVETRGRGLEELSPVRTGEPDNGRIAEVV
jgi:putative MFS transporter